MTERRNRIHTKLIVTFIVLVTAILVASAAVWYRTAASHVRREVENRLLAIAEAGTLVFPPLATASIVNDLGARTRGLAQDELAKVKERFGVRDAYIFDRERRILATTDTVGMDIGAEAPELENYAEQIERVFTAEEAVVTIPFSDDEGNVYQTAIAPLEGCEIDEQTGRETNCTVMAALGVDLSLGFLDVFNDFRRMTVILIVVGIFLTVGVGYVFARTLSRPIGELADTAERMERGEMDEPVRVESKDEIGYLAAALENMRRGILQRDRHLRTMLAGVAHEIRNPLGGIEIFAGLLRDELEEEDDRRNHLEKIIHEVQHLKTIINEFLIYARPRKAVIEPFPLREVLDDLSFLLAGETEERDVEVKIEMADPGIVVHADLDQVKRALLNIVKNAIQASPEGERVEVRAQEIQSKVRIAIKDYGSGIHPDHLKQIFDPFFTTKGMGAGLGLSIVKAIIEENDGEIWVESVPGEKTSFFIVLPAGEAGGDRSEDAPGRSAPAVAEA